MALVDREGRIGKTGTVFYNTLLDENAASHIALGNAYAISVGEEDRQRINTSSIHIDFMIGSDEVAVTGVQADGTEVPVLRGGDWQGSDAAGEVRSGRAPDFRSCGSPRSANGTSITSKSRGTTVAGKTAHASSASSFPK